MAKQIGAAAGRAPIGRLTYPYYDQPGFSLRFSVSAFPDTYAVTVWWNDAPCRRASRRSLAGALTWATKSADHLIGQFGLPPKQVPFAELLTAIQDRLAA